MKYLSGQEISHILTVSTAFDYGKCLTRKSVNFIFYALMLSLKLCVCTVLCLGCTQYRLDTRRKLNVHKTFRRRPGRVLNVFCTFNLRPVSRGISVQVASASTIYFHQFPSCEYRKIFKVRLAIFQHYERKG